MNNKKKHGQAIIDYDMAVEMFEKGLKITEIAEQFGVLPESLRQGLRRRKVNTIQKSVGFLPNISREDIIYIAGLFDGEGSINLNQGPRQTFLSVAVTNTDLPLIEWLRQIVGGSIRVSVKSNPGKKTVYNWTMYSAQAASFLALIFPFLRIKKRQAEIAMEFQARIKYNAGLTDEEIQIRSNLREALLAER